MTDLSSRSIQTTVNSFKIGFNAVFLLPIRVICCFLIFMTATILATIATSGISDEKMRTEPISGWRLKLKKIICALGYALYFCFGLHRVKVNGQRATKQEASIFVVAPHSSIWDTFLFVALGFPCSVSAKENLYIPVFGRFFRAMQPIEVERESNRKEHVTREICNRSDPANAWPQLYIFPEGKVFDECV
jgi:hypothetical protein